MITEREIRLLQAEHEEREEKYRWRGYLLIATAISGATIACLGILYLAGQCLSMAWEMLPV